MPIKSGASHSIAALSLTLISAFIIKYMESHKTFDYVLGLLTAISELIVISLEQWFSLTLEINFVAILLASSSLCFIWGVAYHLSRS